MTHRKSKLEIVFIPPISNSFPTRHLEIGVRLSKNHNVQLLLPEEYIKTLRKKWDLPFLPVSLPVSIGGKFTPRSRFQLYMSGFVPYLREITALLNKRDVDVIINSDPVIGVILHCLSKNHDFMTIFDQIDYMPAFIYNYMPNIPLLNVLGKKTGIALSYRLIKQSNLRVATGITLKKLYKGLPTKTVIIPNGAEGHRFHPSVQGTKIREKEGISPDTFVIGFVGALGFWVQIEEMITAFQAFHTQYPNTRLLVVGPKPRYCREKFNIGEEEGVVWAGRVPYESVPDYIGAMDVCVLPFQKDLTSHASSPVKIHEYAACKKPIISTPLVNVKSYYRDSLLYAKTTHDFQISFERYFKSEALKKEKKTKAYRIFHENFTWEKIATKYEQHLLDLVRS